MSGQVRPHKNQVKSTCLPASILCWRRSPRPESPTETPQLTKSSWWRLKAALTQPLVCDQPCDILALYVRGKRLGCTRAGTFLLTHTRGKTQPCLSLLSNWAGYEIQTACRRNMELCTEMQLCRSRISTRRSSSREKGKSTVLFMTSRRTLGLAPLSSVSQCFYNFLFVQVSPRQLCTVWPWMGPRWTFDYPFLNLSMQCFCYVIYLIHEKL